MYSGLQEARHLASLCAGRLELDLSLRHSLWPGRGSHTQVHTAAPPRARGRGGRVAGARVAASSSRRQQAASIVTRILCSRQEWSCCTSHDTVTPTAG